MQTNAERRERDRDTLQVCHWTISFTRSKSPPAAVVATRTEPKGKAVATTVVTVVS